MKQNLRSDSHVKIQIQVQIYIQIHIHLILSFMSLSLDWQLGVIWQHAPKNMNSRSQLKEDLFEFIHEIEP